MRTKKVIKIILSSSILQVIVVISGLLLPRFFLEEYGSEVNGLVASIKQFLGYLSIAGAGIAVASSAALYTPIAENNVEKTNGILSATKVYFKQTGVVFASVFFLFILLYPFIIDSDLSRILIFSVILIIGLGAIVEQVLINKYTILLMADQKNHIISRTTAIGVVINTVISILFIKLNFSVVVVLMVTALTFYIRLFILKRYVMKNYPKVNYRVNPDMQAISGRWDGFAYQIPGIITAYSPIVIITIFCGLKDVSVYSIYNMVFSSLVMIVSIFSAGIAASFGNIMALKESKILANSFNSYEYLYMIITFFCYTCAFKLILPFVSVYTQGINDADYIIPSVGILFASSGLMYSLRAPYVTLVEAAGKYKENKNLNILEAILCILLSVIFVKFLGISAVLLASLISGTIRTFLFMKFTHEYILKRSNGKLFLRLLVNITAAIGVIVIPLSESINSLLGWFLLAMKVSFITFIVIVGINILFDRKAFMEIYKRVKGLVKIKRLSRV